MIGVDFGIGPTYEIIIVGNPEKEDVKNMLFSLYRRFLPNKVVLLKSPELEELATFIKTYKDIDNKATAYVCIDYQCKLPTTNVEEMMNLLESEFGSQSFKENDL
jgi:uncharacterized protein YyaL (SSP411 family)